MVFIDKTTPPSIKAKEKLEEWKKGLDLERLYTEPNQTGDNLWKKLSGKKVKTTLIKNLRTEQDNICCYCCQTLKFGDNDTSAEHFLAKSAPDRTDKAQAFAERVFNYDNLLLCCDGGRANCDIYTIKTDRYGKIPTKEDIADELGIHVEVLNKLNPSAKYDKGEEIKYRKGKERLYCDASKEDSILPILNPSNVKNCWKLFDIERKTGEMKPSKQVKDSKTIEIIKNTLFVLNLNVEILKKKRKERWELFEERIESPEFKKLHPNLMDYITFRPKDELCFVNYHVIQLLITPSV